MEGEGRRREGSSQKSWGGLGGSQHTAPWPRREPARPWAASACRGKAGCPAPALPKETHLSLFTLIKLLTGFWQIGKKSVCSSNWRFKCHHEQINACSYLIIYELNLLEDKRLLLGGGQASVCTGRRSRPSAASRADSLGEHGSGRQVEAPTPSPPPPPPQAGPHLSPIQSPLVVSSPFPFSCLTATPSSSPRLPDICPTCWALLPVGDSASLSPGCGHHCAARAVPATTNHCWPLRHERHLTVTSEALSHPPTPPSSPSL